MRQTISILLATLLLTFASCSSSSDPMLEQLDRILQEHPQIQQKRIQQIDSLRHASFPTEFDREMALQQDMGNLSLDSAIIHSNKAISLAATPQQKVAAQLSLVKHYITSGVMQNEAATIYNSLDKQALDSAGLRFEYYSTGVQMYRQLSAQTLHPDLRSAYMRKKVEYRDSALMLQPDNAVLLANRYRDTRDYGRAIALLRNQNDGKTFSKADAVRYNILATLYNDINDQEKARQYLTYSAIADLKQGNREYLSLQQLAMNLYKHGDSERAYQYINHSIDDATACNAKQRMIEMSTMLPIIEKAHEESRHYNIIAQGVILTIVALSLIGAIIAAIIIRRQNSKLKAANQEQKSLNKQLAESDGIKEEYVSQFMNLCLEYLAQMEGYRRDLLRTAAHRNFEELVKSIKSTKYIGKGINEFYEKFDEAFLEMFPNFVTNLRKLLQPGYDLHLKDPQHLNTELRILALMRLGFTDSDSICKFLRCSPSTIYNYRTRLRSAALNRDTFDQDILAI